MHSVPELLAILERHYPRAMWPGDAGYDATPEDQRFMRAVCEAGSGAAYRRWTEMLGRLRGSFPGRILSTSLHLVAASRGRCYEGAPVEVVLDKSTGTIVRMRVTKSSAEAAFDAAALRAFQRAQPFGQAPDGLASSDGNVYIQREIRRDPNDLCTTRNAHLFYADGPPPAAP